MDHLQGDVVSATLKEVDGRTMTLKRDPLLSAKAKGQKAQDVAWIMDKQRSKQQQPPDGPPPPMVLPGIGDLSRGQAGSMNPAVIGSGVTPTPISPDLGLPPPGMPPNLPPEQSFGPASIPMAPPPASGVPEINYGMPPNMQMAGMDAGGFGGGFARNSGASAGVPPPLPPPIAPDQPSLSLPGRISAAVQEGRVPRVLSGPAGLVDLAYRGGRGMAQAASEFPGSLMETSADAERRDRAENARSRALATMEGLEPSPPTVGPEAAALKGPQAMKMTPAQREAHNAAAAEAYAAERGIDLSGLPPAAKEEVDDTWGAVDERGGAMLDLITELRDSFSANSERLMQMSQNRDAAAGREVQAMLDTFEEMWAERRERIDEQMRRDQVNELIQGATDIVVAYRGGQPRGQTSNTGDALDALDALDREVMQTHQALMATLSARRDASTAQQMEILQNSMNQMATLSFGALEADQRQQALAEEHRTNVVSEGLQGRAIDAGVERSQLAADATVNASQIRADAASAPQGTEGLSADRNREVQAAFRIIGTGAQNEDGSPADGFTGADISYLENLAVYPEIQGIAPVQAAELINEVIRRMADNARAGRNRQPLTARQVVEEILKEIGERSQQPQ